MLLYGPPGTGKTSLAEEIGKALRWPLITVTPSDFVRGGESQVEERAKMIFEVLGAQRNAVVLFDEIDRMLLDRDSKLYKDQSDIFQFMTPGMLTKLRDLRKREPVIFLIATNYFEHIDPAARRRGRIDLPVLVAPPDVEGRVSIFKALLAKRCGKKRSEFDGTKIEEDLHAVAKETRLKVYGELEQLFADAVDGLSTEDRTDAGKIVEQLLKLKSSDAAITLTSYGPRFQSERDKPLVEFLVLLHLCLEQDGQLGPREKDLADKVLQIMGGKEKPPPAGGRAVERQELEQPIQEALQKDHDLAARILDNYPFDSSKPRTQSAKVTHQPETSKRVTEVTDRRRKTKERKRDV